MRFCQLAKQCRNQNIKAMTKNIFIIIATITLFTSCGNKKSEEEVSNKKKVENTTTLTNAQIKIAGIQTGKIAQKEISATLKLNGKIDVHHKI